MGVIYAPQQSSGGGLGDTIGTLAQIACMVIPGAQVALPYISAAKAVNSAANGNWGGAAMNALGMVNGGAGFNTNYNTNLTSNFANKALQQPVTTDYSSLGKVYDSMKNASSLSDLATDTGIKTTQMLDGGNVLGSNNWNKYKSGSWS